MTTIGPTIPSAYYLAGPPPALDRPVDVERAGSTTPSSHQMDRATYAKKIAELSEGQFTAEEWLERAEESDRMRLKAAESTEAVLAGKGTYIGSSRGNKTFWDPKGAAKAIEQARQARSKPYAHMSGPVTIQALNVDSAVKAQGQLTGGDLKNLSYYADYLRNEITAASSVKSDVTFTGIWGKDRVTHDVSEYIGWLFQAAQAKSQEVAQAGQTA